MKICSGIIWLVATVVWAGLVQAVAAELPYDQLPCRELPTTSLLSLAADQWPFPDADDQVLEQVNYLELANYADDYAALTIMVDSPAYATVLHYASDGRCYLPQPGLYVPADHHLTLSFRLPAADSAAVTRLIVWRDKPEQSWLSMLASQPNFIGEPIPGVLAQQWFPRRGRIAFLQPPWEDQLREKSTNPYGYSSAWPYCQANLTSSAVVLAKDCLVQFHGSTAFAGDSYGVYGSWSLNWGAPLTMLAYLPEELSPIKCELYLYGKPVQTFGLGGTTEIDVSVNDWTLPESPYGAPIGNSELFVYDVSQYLAAGINEFTIGLDSFSGEEWLLERVELWLE